MNNNQLQHAVKKQIQKRERANKITFIAGTFSIAYGVTFAWLFPGVEAIVLGSFIALFGAFLFTFSIVTKQNK